MSSFGTILWLPGGILLRVTALLLLVVQLYMLVLAMRQRRGALLLTGAALHVLFGMSLLALLEDGAYRLDYLSYLREYPAAVRWVDALPWPVIAGLELCSALLLVLAARDRLRHARTHPSAQTVKQAVDQLPAGVGVIDGDGTTLLSNLKLNEYNQALTGSAFSDGKTLLAAVQMRGTPQNGKLLLRLPDETVLLWTQRPLTLDGKQYTQLLAEDVSEQYRGTAALEAKAAAERELQRRMKTYQRRQTELVARQELLAARTTVHSQLGGALLTGKYHLEHPEGTDAAALRLLLEQLNTYLLSEAEEPELRGDALDSALQLAQDIGVRVELHGALPPDGALRELLGQAITECAANTVKHARGDRLTVTLTDGGFRIENNGSPPAHEIVPVGGLRSLRLAAEQAGGRMTLQSLPRFVLELRCP